ncbi:hypothetical protein PoB_003229200 [Plakobranchus ocellatus]|uniref:Uncharacterized protein n=1 Tax=Plakobranchus ocellatus TaxID=259542 RepID=A0AAV4AFW0_9GAST|nr:hypothetical protein PoB_003229200 [Plakobranchus ocellatus]
MAKSKLDTLGLSSEMRVSLVLNLLTIPHKLHVANTKLDTLVLSSEMRVSLVLNLLIIPHKLHMANTKLDTLGLSSEMRARGSSMVAEQARTLTARSSGCRFVVRVSLS